jgi:tRNA-specific 2-thiouridylase
MSGGVDSSVTAALLLDQGFSVEGVTMKLTAGVCCDIGSAQAVCQHLGIAHRLIDAQEAFSRSVIDDFVSEYRSGRTPNPCIRCNDLIKFQLLLDYARANGFDLLATGHYARIERSGPRFLLKKGLDTGKDQSYFLYRLTQKQMQHLVLPLGGLVKSDVRARARLLGLPAAERPESQEICFVPDNNYRSFLKERAPETLRPGEMEMTDGTVVGRHEGIAFFTVGQRRKLGVAAGERLYVIRVEPDAHKVVLGKKADLEASEMLVSSPNLTAGKTLTTPLPVTVKVRYRSSFVPAVIHPAEHGMIRVRFDQAVPGVCPGQAAVFYDGDVAPGGGIIQRRFTNGHQTHPPPRGAGPGGGGLNGRPLFSLLWDGYNVPGLGKCDDSYGSEKVANMICIN